MKNVVPYVNEEVSGRDFKYYIFDWDDNILHMPTKILMEHLEEDGTWRPVELSTASFALVRSDHRHYRPPSDGGWRAAFRNFADPEKAGEKNKFIEDTMTALARVSAGEKPSPSYSTFKKTLVEGRIFAIVTARGHAPETIERAVRLFIENALTPLERETMMSNLRGYRRWLDKVETFGTDEEELNYYLGMCRYSAVTYDGCDPRLRGARVPHAPAHGRAGEVRRDRLLGRRQGQREERLELHTLGAGAAVRRHKVRSIRYVRPFALEGAQGVRLRADEPPRLLGVYW